MANGPRSIYSRRQRMAPGQYDNPFADFLDNLPGYINQFQRNQLELGKQQLANKRYDDAQEQQEFTNELNLIRSLPEDAQANAFATSKIPRMQSAGIQMQSKKQAFTDRLNSVYTENAGDPTAIKVGLEALSSEPDIINNESYITKINNRIEIEKPKVARQQVDTWAKDNPDDPRVNEIVAMSKLDSEKALGLIVPQRTTVSTSQKQVYNPYTKEYRYATDSEIATANATETKKDDLIPISGAPKQSGSSTMSLTQVNKAITDVKNALNPRRRKMNKLDPLTTDQVANLQSRLDVFERQRDSLFGIESAPTEKKTIPGF
tara:strand:+ start:5696 stop:6652 length:957 start_codon:yes stop_codon:yes gene_type:complete